MQVTSHLQTSPHKAASKTYIFKVNVERDEDRWFAYCPALKKYAATSWGYTREEALENIHTVVKMVVEELIEDGIAIPESPRDQVTVSKESRVAVTT